MGRVDAGGGGGGGGMEPAPLNELRCCSTPAAAGGMEAANPEGGDAGAREPETVAVLKL